MVLVVNCNDVKKNNFVFPAKNRQLIFALYWFLLFYFLDPYDDFNNQQYRGL